MRPLNMQVRLDNLRQNYRFLKGLHGNKLLAVIKTGTCGYGAVRCAHALTGIADGFAVATVDKGAELRQNDIKNPTILLEGVFRVAEYADVDRYDLWPATDSQWQSRAFAYHEWQHPIIVWLKMDPGMHRAGFFPHNYATAYMALRQPESIESIVKFGHLTYADKPESGMTEMQLEAFDLTYEGLEGEGNLTDSAAILNVPEAHHDWDRAGLALYGISPFGSVDERLKPVMCLVSHVFGECVLQPYSPIGYGTTFYTSKSTRVGLIARGHTNGYPRHASTSSPVVIGGKHSRIIGRVSMNMITVELEASKEGLGAGVKLWGDMININEVAEVAGVIPYEIFCNIKRARFTYIE